MVAVDRMGSVAPEGGEALKARSHDAQAAPARSSDSRGPAEQVLYLVTRRPKKALGLARRALEAGAGSLSAQERGRLERALGHSLRAVGDYQGARAAYLKARRTF